jgi:hypothetical protein
MFQVSKISFSTILFESRVSVRSNIFSEKVEKRLHLGG